MGNCIKARTDKTPAAVIAIEVILAANNSCLSFCLLLSYFFFKGHCFMTLLANKYSGKKESPLHIRMKTARTILFFNLIFAIF